MEKNFELPAGTPNGLIHESRRRNRIAGDQSQVVAEETAGVVELRPHAYHADRKSVRGRGPETNGLLRGQ